ncbi:MAG TPA: cytochrome C oxidase subunit IV family protein [Polyangiaceae bacterium]|nr:cytochrome C oxidase subunit IV family protein [Polyangiaceae bacterium]
MSDPPRASSYLWAWLTLVLLTGISFGASRLHLGRWAALVALAIACVKGGVVLTVFMHLYRAPFVLRFVAILNIAWVALLCAGVAADVAAR